MKLVKQLLSILLPFSFSACAHRTLEGRVKPVYFSAAPVVFTDTLARDHSVYFQNMKKLGVPCDEVVNLKPGIAVKTFIAEPTIFGMGSSAFLVYPRDRIFITADPAREFHPTFSTVSKNKTRDGELLVLQKFQELEKRVVVPALTQYNYQVIADTARVIQDLVSQREQASQQLFDSLCAVYKVSRKFRKITRDFVHNRYDMTVVELYQVYRDTLKQRQVYKEKVSAFLPVVNRETSTAQFTSNLQTNTNWLYTALFPDNGIRNMVSKRGGFQACFDSIIKHFTGPARDYLLSRLMFRNIEQGYSIPAGYYQHYRQFSMNKSYRKIIDRYIEQVKVAQRNKPVFPNELLLSDGRTTAGLDTVLAGHKGKYILVDLWASWCGPCLKEMPALEALKNKYAADKISFLTVSVDTNIAAWLSRLEELHDDKSTSFLLLHKDSAALVRQVGLSTIPRYLLYDKDGTLMESDAPTPSDPELEKLLNKILEE